MQGNPFFIAALAGIPSHELHLMNKEQKVDPEIVEDFTKFQIRIAEIDPSTVAGYVGAVLVRNQSGQKCVGCGEVHESASGHSVYGSASGDEVDVKALMLMAADEADL